MLTCDEIKTCLTNSIIVRFRLSSEAKIVNQRWTKVHHFQCSSVRFRSRELKLAWLRALTRSTRLMVSSATKANSGSFIFHHSALAIAALSMPTLTLKHKELDGIFTSRAVLHADIHSQEEPLD